MSRTYDVFLCLETSREYGRGLLRGIYRYSSAQRGWQINQETPFYLEDSSAIKGQACKFPSDVDGVIARDHRGSQAFVKKGIPTIFASYLHKDIPDTYRIVTDDRAVGRMVAAHLLERGFRCFGFIGYDRMYWSQQRKESFAGLLQSYGHPCAVFVQARDRKLRRWPTEQKRLADWLMALPKPVGLMACNDDRARNVVDVCRAVGLRVPAEVSVVGVDNDEFVCNLSNPSISSVALDVEDAGYHAAQLLDQLMKGDSIAPCHIPTLPTAVVTRQSTDILAIEDPVVAEAVRFIRTNCRRPIQVPDVLREVTISRRSLYDRFKRVLGCSVYEYIKRVRVAEIERLLLDTDYSITEIADLVGFSTPDHIASYFRSVRGINPLTLRLRSASR